jgi:hypothetical protein
MATDHAQGKVNGHDTDCQSQQDGAYPHCTCLPTSSPPAPEPGMEKECRECECTTGGGEYCYEHAPYTVWPLKNGTFRYDRNGMKHVVLLEPPSHESEQIASQQQEIERLQAERDGWQQGYDIRGETVLDLAGRLDTALDRAEAAESLLKAQQTENERLQAELDHECHEKETAADAHKALIQWHRRRWEAQQTALQQVVESVRAVADSMGHPLMADYRIRLLDALTASSTQQDPVSRRDLSVEGRNGQGTTEEDR